MHRKLCQQSTTIVDDDRHAELSKIQHINCEKKMASNVRFRQQPKKNKKTNTHRKIQGHFLDRHLFSCVWKTHARHRQKHSRVAVDARQWGGQKSEEQSANKDESRPYEDDSDAYIRVFLGDALTTRWATCKRKKFTIKSWYYDIQWTG